MRARLRVQGPGAPARVVDLDGPCTVGGGADQVRIPDLPAGALALAPAPDGVVVEGRHREIVAAGRALPPGTRRLLLAGEDVALGGWTLSPTRDDVPEDTRALARAVLSGAPPTPAGAWLLVAEGPDAGTRLPLHDGVALGRGGRCGLRVSDALASRRHLVFEVAGGCVRVRDLRSKNGTWIGGRRVKAAARALAPGDVIVMGVTTLRYCGPAAAPAAAAPVATAAVSRRRVVDAVLASAVLLALAAALAFAAS